MGRILDFIVWAPRWQLFVASVLSRVVLAAWVILVGTYLADYDESARLNDVDLRLPRIVHGTRSAPRFPMLWHWDAVHYRHIADYGYTHESSFAFFPFIPLMIRSLERGLPSCPFVAFTRLQFLFFGASVVAMRRALFAIVDDELDAFAAAAADPKAKRDGSEVDRIRRTNTVVGAAVIFYILSPASIFTVASYTEPFYCALTLGAFVLLRRGWAILGSVWFALATASRSNGILAAAFLLQDALRLCWRRYRGDPTEEAVRRASSLAERSAEPRVHRTLLQDVAGRVIGAAVAVLPYFIVNRSAFSSFCKAIRRPAEDAPWYLQQASAAFHSVLDAVPEPFVDSARAALVAVDDAVYGVASESKVTAAHAATLPHTCPTNWLATYTHIQKRYWGLDWFSYYEFRNTHNFAIAGPLYVGMAVALLYAWRCTGWRLLRVSQWVPGLVCGSPHTTWLFLMLFIAMTRMHIQVTTRFVYMSPAFYLLLGATAARWKLFWGYLLLYVVAFAMLSPVLYANFYPWT
jgi:hypothetical protein